jgi:photosystem II stability/assembly factor-like uncharacterized protein
MRGFNSEFSTFVAVVALLAPPLAMGTDMVTALAVDARTPPTIYAGTNASGVFRSTDGGTSWSQSGLTGLWVESLVVDLKTPSTVYAVASGGLFRSADRGQSWSVLNHPSEVGGVRALAIDPSNPSTLYVGLHVYYVDEEELLRNGGGVAKSTDGGTNWTSVLFPSGVLAIAIDPLDPTKLVAGTEQVPGWMGPDPYGDVFTSADGGVTWNPSQMWWGSVYLAAAHAPPSTIYVVTSSGAFVNLSTGTVGYPPNAVGALAVDPSNPATVYVGNGNWVYRSTDAGFRWYQTSPQKNCLGYPDCMVTALAIDAAGSGTLYAGTFDGRVHKSTDGGVSWAAIGLAPTPADATAPDTSIVSAVDGAGASVVAGAATLERNIMLSFTGMDNVSVSSFTCRIDAGAFAPCSTPVTYSALTLGNHRFEVRAADAAGNQDNSPAAFEWSVDARPDTTITSALDNRGNEILNGGSTRSDMITFKFAGDDNNGITGFECSMDATAFAPCSSPRILKGISRGAHSFRVRAVDSRAFRDQSPAAFSWSRR